MKKLLATLLILAMCLSFAACAANTDAEPAKQPESATPAAEATAAPESAAPQKKILIGISLGNMGDVFDRILYDGMMKYAEENKDKVELQVLNAQGDMSMQITNVDQLLNSKIDVLLLWPWDMDGGTPAVQNANAKNVPVICVNTRTSGGEFIYVGSDDIVAGRIQGEWLAANLPENATYCYFMGPIGHSGQIGRKQGLEEVLGAKRPDVKKLAEQTGQWDRAKALDIADDWLKAFPEVTAFVSQNDNMALGIIEALRTSNKLGSIMVVGTDATSEACGSIKNGELSMSVFQNAEKQGYKSVEVAYLTALSQWTSGDYDIPFEPVDAKNVDQYIEMYKNAG